MKNRTAPKQQKDQLGRRLCRVPMCGKVVPKGRQSYCSRECATAFEIAYFPAMTRSHVFRRDNGVCAKCGLDTVKFMRVLRAANDMANEELFGSAQRWPFMRELARSFGFSGSYYQDGAFWQADHVIECVNGGWGLGLENFRTLCTPCHQEETARLARELAEKRRAQKQPIEQSLFAGLGT